MNDNKEIMNGNDTDDTIQEIFDSLLQKYQKDSEESIKGS